jgi:hypothetical protein
MGSLGRSWQLMKASLQVLREDKEILLLPILSFVSAVIILGTFITGFFVTGTLFSFSWLIVIGFFLMYLILYFVIIFFNTAVIACADIRLKGGDPTIREGLHIASQHIGKILTWSLISATVGIILQGVRERSGMLGRIVVAIIGIAWTALTFFILPVLIYENKGVLSSIKRSGSLFRQTWGETLVGTIGFGIIFFLIALLGLVPIGIGVMIGGFYPIIIGVIIAALFWIIIGATASALNGIYVTALYHYATEGKLPAPFNPSLLPPAITNTHYP